jgi:predicted P-loop ATPase
LPDYLKERPTTRTAAPLDERMSRAQRWVPWTLKNVPGRPKPSKVPIGHSNAPNSWTFFQAARVTLEDPKISGLGFQMFGRPGIIGIDVDNCVEGAGKYTALAAQLLALLEAAGAKYHVELTPSGKGLRVFAGETNLPFHDFLEHDAGGKDQGLEVYQGETARYLTYTGAVIPGFGSGPFAPLDEATVAFLGKYTKKIKGGAAPGGEPAKDDGVPDPALPELSRRDDWKKLHPNAIKRLSKDHKEFLESGAIGSKYASASENLFAVEQALLKNLKPPQAYQVLVSAEGSWSIAIEHREGNERRAREFLWSDIKRAALSREKHETEKASAEAGWKDCDILVELVEDGTRARILQINEINALTKHPEWINRLGYNTFDGRVTIDRRDATVRDVAEISAWLTQFLKWPFEPKRNQFEESLVEAAKMRPWNPVEQELRGLTWDGKTRIKAFADAIVGDDAEKIDRDILRKWLVGYVARGLKPGCQMDTVLCLRERVGGGFKTQFCRVMAGTLDRYADAPGFGSDKESSMLRVGQRLVELGEGTAARRGDRHALKRDITQLFDHFRAPWGKEAGKRLRGFVYVLTANDFAFLRSDQDGLRRIWPLNAADVIDIKWVVENRDQLLAEAVALFDAGEAWWWDKGKEPAELRVRQRTAVSEDFLDAAVEGVIADRENVERGYTTLLELKKTVEAVAGVVLTSAQSQHLIDVLSKHGFEPGRVRIEDAQRRVWTHPMWIKSGAGGDVIPFRPAAPVVDRTESVTPETPCDRGGVTEKPE